MNVSSCSIRLRRSSLAAGERGAQRLGDVLDLADPTAVEQQRDRGQRLLGGRVACPPTTAGSATPRAACPAAWTSVGGASSTCSEPSRLVWPILAVALAGSSTSPSSRIVTSACQPCRSILVTLPTVTSPTRTREFCSSVVDVGQLRLDRERARAAARGARQRQRVQPRHRAAGQPDRRPATASSRRDARDAPEAPS